MESRLPAQAELYLRDLEKALWPLGSDERETILLELRSHLTGCAAQGADRLHQALQSLGTPEECSRAFVVEGSGETYRKVGMPGRALVPLAPPPEFSRQLQTLSVRQIVAQVQATYRASRPNFWAIGALLVTVLTSTNFLYYISELTPGTVKETWPIAMIRLLVILAALAAAYRTILSEDQRVWSMDLSSLRFAGGMVALAVVAAGTVLAAKAALTSALPAAALPVARPLLLIALLLGFSLLYLRVQPWIAALAADRRDVSLRQVLAGTRGKTGAIVKGWSVLVLPFCLAHFGVTMFVLNTAPLRPFHLALAGLDGVISACLAISAALLNATVFRWVTGEAIPAPRSFNPDMPSEKFVEEARARLQMHIDAGGSRFAQP